jgi:hypothetical protein
MQQSPTRVTLFTNGADESCLYRSAAVAPRFLYEQVIALVPTAGFYEFDRRMFVAQKVLILAWRDLIVFFVIYDAVANRY